MNLSLKITKNRSPSPFPPHLRGREGWGWSDCFVSLAATSSIFIIAMLLPSCSALTPQDHYNLAIDYSQKGQPSDAEKKYKEAISANPNLYQAHNNLGAIYMKQAQFAKAETSFKSALTIRPDYLPAIENLASIYDGMGGERKRGI